MTARTCITRGVVAVAGAMFAMMVLDPSRGTAATVEGQWCAEDGSSLSIEDGNLFLDSGAQINGTATDQSYTYTAPDPGPNAGARISMFAIGEDTLRVVVEGEHFSEDLNRCQPTS